MNTKQYIIENLKYSKRTKGCSPSSLTLPYPYLSPCSKGLFDDFFYWDTYFINRGLLSIGDFEQTKNNLLDFCYLIDTYGFIPNSSNENLLDRSQPPLFIKAVYEYYKVTLDLAFVEYAYDRMNTELNWWIKNRSFDNGLLHYGNEASDETKLLFAKLYKERTKVIFNEPSISIGSNALSECESGWDFTYRFNGHIENYAPIDLNCLIYENFKIMSKFSKLLNKKDIYISQAANQKKLINRFLVSRTYYNDYDYKNDKLNDYYSIASVLPFVTGLSKSVNKYMSIYKKVKFKQGYGAGEKINVSNNYQWGSANMWPNLVLFLYDAAKQLNLKDIQQEIKEKYISIIDKEYERTGHLWEKYDVLTGQKSSLNEYTETCMLGWTAGTYLYLKKEQ